NPSHESWNARRAWSLRAVWFQTHWSARAPHGETLSGELASRRRLLIRTARNGLRLRVLFPEKISERSRQRDFVHFVFRSQGPLDLLAGALVVHRAEVLQSRERGRFSRFGGRIDCPPGSHQFLVRIQSHHTDDERHLPE